VTRLATRTTVLLTAVALVGVGTTLLTGCSAASDGGTGGGTGTGTGPTATASAHTSAGALGAGFSDPDQPPAPEATIHPEPGSWSGVHAPADYDVVLLSDAGDAADDAPTRTLVDAVESWAADEDVTVTEIAAKDADDRIAAVVRAVDAEPDLVISVGNHMVDPLAAVSPTALHQQFLVVGAEIAEPTSNVTAADWTGGGFRGEGLGPSSHYDPDTFTEARAARALRAGLAAVLHDLRGIVVWVP
jgi:basic membrane lipoprotein Med (substrate-binding protein (PBP1-ABC) superfamily)